LLVAIAPLPRIPRTEAVGHRGHKVVLVYIVVEVHVQRKFVVEDIRVVVRPLGLGVLAVPAVHCVVCVPD
jgi:hypothetical protein